MHGVGGGARKGNKNAVKHGAMVAESFALIAVIAEPNR